MSMNGGRFPQSVDDLGQTVASFPTYEAAQKAVSTLIAAEIPARDIAIVGQGLRSVPPSSFLDLSAPRARTITAAICPPRWASSPRARRAWTHLSSSLKSATP